jgi:hypothetical protein
MNDKRHSIYVIILNNETEFITEIRGRNGGLDIPKFRTSIGQRSFRGTKVWNDLDTELKPISDLNSFKTKLKANLIEKPCLFLTHKL